MYIYIHIYLVSKTVDKDKNCLPCPAHIPRKSLLSLGQPLESLTPQIHQSKRMTGQARERAGGQGLIKVREEERKGSPGTEQPLGRGSVLSRLGAELELRRCGSSLGPSQYSLASTRRQPASSLPRSGHWAPNLGPK